MSRRGIVVIGVVVVLAMAGMAVFVQAADRERLAAAEAARQAFYKAYPALARRECLVAVPGTEALTDGVKVACHEARDVDLVVLQEGGCPAEAIYADAVPITTAGRGVCVHLLGWYKESGWDRANGY